VEGAVIPILKGMLAVVIGAVLLLVGRNNWRHRDTEAVPVLEDHILRLSGEEPLPRTRFDRVSRRIQAGLGLVLGLFFLFVGLLILAGEVGLI